MATVLGIGGVFVKSKDADALRAWYREMLGVEIQEWGGAQFRATPAQTYSVWSAFRAETKYFAPSEREFMINLRVDDLDGLLAKLRAQGARVLDRREDSPDGKFGYVVDPDDTLLELWEAPAAG
ncbi:MAG TPA: VOC family protein [Kofleriaceae bacterium]|nr:VOC family protein [Kofleriaceae bacterium]